MYQARSRPTHPAHRRGIVVLPYDEQWCPLSLMVNQTTLAASGAWTTGNTAVGFWITAPYDCTVSKMGWINGSAVTGTHDVALYDSDGTTRLTSAGATAQSGASAFQFVNTADVSLTAGKDYFVAANHAATTANECWTITTTAMPLGPQLLGGVKVQAVGATALPNPFVPANPASAVALPIIALTLNSLI